MRTNLPEPRSFFHLAMLRLGCLVMLQAVFAVVSIAQERPAPGPAEIARMPVVYRIAGMEKVLVRTDIRYAPSGPDHLLMDVYAPRRVRRAAKLPAVIFIHGSVPPGSPAKNMEAFRSWGRLAAASGMVGVTFNHRLGFPRPELATAAADIASAIEHVRTNADSLNVDKDRICLIAFSGGGPMLAPVMRERPAYVRCLVAFYTFMDIQRSEMHRPHESANVLASFSPINFLEGPGLPPMFIARAGRDQIPELNSSIDEFTRRAFSANAPLTVVNHPTGGHAFDIFTPDSRSREIVRDALRFMSHHLGADGK